MNIRLLNENDAQFFQNIRLRALQESPSAFAVTVEEFQQEGLSQIAERLRPLGEPPEQFVLGAFAAEDTLIGTVGIFREKHKKMRHKATIWGMYVAPEARGQGVGKQLLQELIRRSVAIPGLEQLHLTVVVPNEAARSLYLASGFRVYGLESHAFKQGGHYWDEELMVLSLQSL